MCPTSDLSRRTSNPPEIHEPKCPVTHHSSDVHPHNNIPDLSKSLAPQTNQLTVPLPVTRTVSSIPRAPSSLNYNVDKNSDAVDRHTKWEYPSPQQFYNALLRKGWNFPEEHMQPMLLLHNRLNEDAWQEILKWESRSKVGRGTEEGALPELAHFEGLHGKWSHKARLYQLGRCLLPAYFPFTPPFDRHDWIIRRPSTNKKVRYVIDYYSSRGGVGGEQVFHLDVRPALDSFGNIRVRLMSAIEKLISKIHRIPVPIPSLDLNWLNLSSEVIKDMFLEDKR